MKRQTIVVEGPQGGRVCLAIEIDPLFVDLAIRRWQAFTGEKAIRESDGAYFEVLDQAARLPEPAS
jgi:DNA modification methylase